MPLRNAALHIVVRHITKQLITPMPDVLIENERNKNTFFLFFDIFRYVSEFK